MTKKLTFSPIAIDLGAKNSGVYMPHYSYGDCLNDIKDKRQVVEISVPRAELETVPDSQPKPKQSPVLAEKESSKKGYLTLISLALPKPLERLKDKACRNHKTQSRFLRDPIEENCKRGSR